jgi:hypothetical protein
MLSSSGRCSASESAVVPAGGARAFGLIENLPSNMYYPRHRKKMHKLLKNGTRWTRFTKITRKKPSGRRKGLISAEKVGGEARKADFSRERLISAKKGSIQPRKVEGEEKKADFSKKRLISAKKG